MQRFVLFAPLAAIAALGLGGCSVQASHTARKARTDMVGATATELDACAGTPNQVEQFGPRVQYRTYSHDQSDQSGFSVTLPVIGGISFGGGGYCRATFQLQDGKVVALRYAGDKDTLLAPNSVCGPMIATCVNQLNEIRQSEASQPALEPGQESRYYRP